MRNVYTLKGNKTHLYSLFLPDGGKKFFNNKYKTYTQPRIAYPFPPSGSWVRSLSMHTRNFSIIVRLKAARYSSCS